MALLPRLFAAGCRDWVSTQLPASFKGVPFEVESEGKLGGRRVHVHEYPAREFWDIEDMGRTTQRVVVAGYVGGALADVHAELLLAACSSFSPGPLILPNRPPIMAVCEQVASTWEADTLGRIGMEMDFVVVSPSLGGIVPILQLSQMVSNIARQSSAIIADQFAVRVNSLSSRAKDTRIPSVARIAAAEAIRVAGLNFIDVRRLAVIEEKDVATRLDASVRYMRKNAVYLAYQGERGDRVDPTDYVRDQQPTVAEFGTVWASSVRDLVRYARNPDAVAEGMASLATFEPPLVTEGPTCQSIRMERAFAGEVAGLVRRTALLGLATAATRRDFISRADAIATRAAIASAFDLEIERTSDEEMHGTSEHLIEEALMATRNAAVDYLTRAGAERPTVVRVSLTGDFPAAVIATSLYRDPSRDREIFLRNRATHPNHMPSDLEVLAPPAVGAPDGV
jgi:hypothetical protein